MRAVVQRVIAGAVEIEGSLVASIAKGLVVLVAVRHEDRKDQAKLLAQKVVNLRVFADEQGKFNRSAIELGLDILVVSQFTLYGDTRKGRRPSFVASAAAEQAESIINHFISVLKQSGLRVESGQFGAHMLVTIQNDGPVTLILDVD